MSTARSFLIGLGHAALVLFGLAAPPAEARVRVALPPAETLTGPTIAGRVVVHRRVQSQHLAHARDVYIYLPPGYRAGRSRYPVLYAHDGNNLFDARTAFLGREWGLDEAAEKLISGGLVPPMVIVGVGNSPGRMAEYTWVRGTVQGQPAGGDGAKYARFLVEELKPAIDAKYRTLTGPGDTATLGSSLGGLISLYLGIHHPETFGRLAVVSPSVWWSNRAALADVRHLRPGLRIWLDIGLHEGDPGSPPPAVADVRALERLLESLGYQPGSDLAYHEDPNGTHDEPSWSRRLPRILRYLFADDGAFKSAVR